MKRLLIAGSILFALAALPAMAGTPPTEPVAPESPISPGEVRATPEMWFYEQYRQEYQDPKMAVRRAAEFRGEQRRQRLAAMAWFGMSNQRPQVSHDPFNADWSPSWTSNNSVYPFRWNGNGWAYSASRPLIVVAPSTY